MKLFLWVLALVTVTVLMLAFSVYRRRRPSSLEAGLRDFRRGLDALDPANDPMRRNRTDARGTGREQDPNAGEDPRPDGRR